MEWLKTQTIEAYSQAYAMLAAIDPAFMNSILIGVLGISCVLGITWAGRKIASIPAVRRWGETRTMKKRRLKVLHQYGADIIQDGLDKKKNKKQITAEEWEYELRRYAHILNMPDLIPPRDAEVVKKSIRWRLAYFIPFLGKIPGPKPGEKEAAKKDNEVLVFSA